MEPISITILACLVVFFLSFIVFWFSTASELNKIQTDLTTKASQEYVSQAHHNEAKCIEDLSSTINHAICIQFSEMTTVMQRFSQTDRSVLSGCITSTLNQRPEIALANLEAHFRKTRNPEGIMLTQSMAKILQEKPKRKKPGSPQP